jgi:hypothetical protein
MDQQQQRQTTTMRLKEGADECRAERIASAKRALAAPAALAAQLQ